MSLSYFVFNQVGGVGLCIAEDHCVASIVVLYAVVAFVLCLVFEGWDAKLARIVGVACGISGEDEANKHAVVRLAIDLLLAGVSVRVGAIVREVETLAQQAEVGKADVKAFFALEDDLWVGAASARAMEEKLDEL